MENKKRHHYVPQFYLKGFAIDPSVEKPEVYVYEKGSQQNRTSKIMQVAFQNHFYTRSDDQGNKDSNTVEDFFANEIEAPANPVLEKIRDRQTISAQDKETLSRYMMFLIRRVPRHKERILSEAPKFVDTVAQETLSDLDEAIVAHPHREQFLTAQREAAECIFDEYGRGIPNDLVIGIMSQDNAAIAKAISSMTWRFLVYDKKPAFITSDNPVFFFESMGIGHHYSEITLPISTNVALLATWRNVEEGYVPTTEQAVKEITRRTISSATRNVFSAFRAPWIQTVIKKSHHRLNRLIV